MTSPSFSTASGAATPDTARNYRILWRWHFYAGLFVMPFLIVLAITGSLYAFKPQLERAMYGDLMYVAAGQARLTYARQLNVAAKAVPAGATLLSVAVAADPTRSTDAIYRIGPDQSVSVFINPYTGVLLGTLSVEHRLMKQVRQLHRDLMLGTTGALVMELASCWALVMIGTGVALWWPGRRWSIWGTFLPRMQLRGRSLWREMHLVGGIWIAAGAVFFLLSGLPWSNFWGKNFQALVTVGLGSPSAEDSKHSGTNHGGHVMPQTVGDLPLGEVPWGVAATAMPMAHLLQPHEWPRRELDIDAVASLAAAHGLSSYQLVLPSGGNGIYTASYGTSSPGYVRADLRQQRTLHVDQYSGTVLKDQGYDDLNAVSKLVGYGVALHMGEYFGLANQLISAAISLALLGMAVSGAVMWWLRRPARSLGAPKRVPRAPSSLRRWQCYLAAMGILFPLMGASMLAVWLADRLFFSPRAA